MKSMKSIIKSIAVSLLFFSTCFLELLAQVNNVKIKAGIIMKSGDIKTIARQDFLVVDKDVITDLLLSAKNNYGINRLDVENTFKEKLDYENKIKISEINISHLNVQIDNLAKEREGAINEKLSFRELQAQYILLKDHLKTSIDVGERWNLDKDFQTYYKWMGSDLLNYSEFSGMLVGLNSKYLHVMEEKRNEAYIKEWKSQYEEFKKIAEPFRAISIDISIEENKKEISENHKNDEALKAVLKNEIENEIESIKQRKMNEFRIIFIKSIKSSFKTNLLGEASISIQKGRYYIVGYAQIGENEVIWDYPISIEKDAQYYELSNDNALALNDAYIIGIVKILFVN